MQGGAFFFGRCASVYSIPALVVGCRLVENTARSGGALSAGKDESMERRQRIRDQAIVRIQDSQFVSNHAHLVGGAVLLHDGGVLDLFRSTFHDNFAAANSSNSSDGVGIANRGGDVQCETSGCLPVCTRCPSPPPTPPPAVFPIVFDHPAETRKWSWPVKSDSLVFGLVAILAIAMVPVVVWARGHRSGGCDSGPNADGGASVLPSNQQSLLRLVDDDASCVSGSESMSVELVARSVLHSYESSPAPVFAVDREGMRVLLWSSGMGVAAPMLQNPVGWLVSDLPFVNAADGHQLEQFLKRIFEVPAEREHAQTFMLYIHTQNRQVLLEMAASRVFVTESEPIVVMTGRQVDSDLAGLMASGNTLLWQFEHARDDATEDDCVSGGFPDLRSASQAGSVVDGDDDNASLPANHADAVDTGRLSRRAGGAAPRRRVDDDVCSSVISDLTTPTMNGGTSVCSPPATRTATVPTSRPSPVQEVPTSSSSDDVLRDIDHVTALGSCAREIEKLQQEQHALGDPNDTSTAGNTTSSAWSGSVDSPVAF